MPRVAPAIELNPAMKATLDHLERSASTSQALALRSRIVLAAAAGQANQQIATALQVPEVTVGKWRRCFASPGWLAGCGSFRKATETWSGNPAESAEPGVPAAGTLQPLERAHAGHGPGVASQHRASDVGGFGSAAPSDSQLHVQSRSRFRGQTAGRRRPVLEPARPRAGALRR